MREIHVRRSTHVRCSSTEYGVRSIQQHTSGGRAKLTPAGESRERTRVQRESERETLRTSNHAERIMVGYSIQKMDRIVE